MVCLFMCNYMSSPFLCVFDDDCVIRYARADNVLGGPGEA